jgi:uncharacterized membrane protein
VVGSKSSWLLVIAGALVVCALNAGGAAIDALRLALTLPLIFVLPGFLLLRLLAPSQSFGFESLVLTIGTSLVSAITLGLVLHFFSALTPTGWAVGFSLLILAAVSLRRFLDGKTRAPSRVLAASGGVEWRLKALPVAAALVSLVLVPLLIGVAATLAWRGASNHRQFAYTELWIRPSESGGVTIGVKNQEQRDVRYDLEVRVNGDIFVSRPDYVLHEDEQRLETLAIPVDELSVRRVEARLYRNEGDRKLYRQVWLSKGGLEGP